MKAKGWTSTAEVKAAKSQTGPSLWMKPITLRCLKKSFVPRHLVNKSAGLLIPGLCLTTNLPDEIWSNFDTSQKLQRWRVTFWKICTTSGLDTSARLYRRRCVNRANEQLPGSKVGLHTPQLRKNWEKGSVAALQKTWLTTFQEHNAPANTFASIETIWCERGVCEVRWQSEHKV